MKVEFVKAVADLPDNVVEDIYRKRDLEYKMEDVRSQLEQYLEDGTEEYGDELFVGDRHLTDDEMRKLIDDDDFIRNIAERFDKAIGNNGSYMDCYWATMQEVIEEVFEKEE